MDTVTARKRLEEMRGELDKSIMVLQGEQPAERSGSDSPQDPADAGSNLSENDRTQAVLAAAKVQLGAVHDALQRIEHGTYGTCADCGSAIPEGRLDARPGPHAASNARPNRTAALAVAVSPAAVQPAAVTLRPLASAHPLRRANCGRPPPG